MTGPSPTLSGFQDFITNVMGVPSTALPPTSPYIGYAYAVALEVVNQAIQVSSPMMYTLAVYNLGGDNLINYAPDQPGQTYFSAVREDMHITGFVAGVVQSASDDGTGDSLVVQEAFKNLTLSDLQNLKTPYGRTYLGIAQRYGSIWGVT